jgi:hypothetical protein
VAIAAAVLVVVPFAVNGVRTVDHSHRRPPYKQVAAVIKKSAKPGDAAVLLNVFPSAQAVTHEPYRLQLAIPIGGALPALEAGIPQLRAHPPTRAGSTLFLVVPGKTTPLQPLGARYRLERAQQLFTGGVWLRLYAYRVLR